MPKSEDNELQRIGGDPKRVRVCQHAGMTHVVMQASEWRSTEDAIRAEAELRSLFDAYARFEREDPSPWAQDRVPPPLVEFGRKHGVEWP